MTFLVDDGSSDESFESSNDDNNVLSSESEEISDGEDNLISDDESTSELAELTSEKSSHDSEYEQVQDFENDEDDSTTDDDVLYSLPSPNKYSSIFKGLRK